MDTTNLSSDRSSYLANCDSGIENYSGTSGNSSILLNTNSIATIEHNAAVGGAVTSDSGADGGGIQLNENSETTSAVLDLSDVQENDDLQKNLNDDDTSEEDFKNDDTSYQQKRISSDSCSTFEIIDNPPITDLNDLPENKQLIRDNIEKLELDLKTTTTSGTNKNIIKLPQQLRQNSQSSTKTCEADLGEERDTFSPISNYGGYSSDHHHDDHQMINDTIINFNQQHERNDDSNNIFTPTTTAATTTITTGCIVVNDGGNIIIDDTHDLILPLSTSNSIGKTTTLVALVNNNSSDSICVNGGGNSSSSDLVDNKIFEKKKIKSTSSTKEEKQRQNEEIVIMETSSVSSETGSWESVFPHRSTVTSVITSNDVEVKDCCHNFLQNERKNCDQCATRVAPTTTNLIDPKNNSSAAASTTACFIDAASLLDESEMIYSNLLPPQLPETGCFGPEPINSKQSPSISTTTPIDGKKYENSPHNDEQNKSDSSSTTTTTTQDTSSWGKKMNLDKLETFYKSFDMCKSTKPSTSEYNRHQKKKSKKYICDDGDGDGSSSNSSSCSSDSPHKGEIINWGMTTTAAAAAAATEENTNNLSDEEKLWKRENSKKKSSSSTKVFIKDQYNKESPTEELYPKTKFNSKSNGTCSSAISNDKLKNDTASTNNVLSKRQNVIENESNDDEEIEIRRRLRKDHERKQGNLVFQNNIQQFSGHLISPKIPFPITNPITTGLINEHNNFVDLSTNSSVPSLLWSDLDTNNTRYPTNNDSSSNFGDTSDFGETSSNYNTRIQSDSDAAPTSSSYILPDTPHNSIVQIGTSLNTTLNLSNKTDNSDKSLKYFDDLENGIKIPPKKSLRCDDSAPIVSGGASIKDFIDIKKCESPIVRRKTDTCPIVSGGFISLDFQRNDESEMEIKANNNKTRDKQERLKQQTWVVDMSDCNSSNNSKYSITTSQQRRRSTSSSSSNENTTAQSINNCVGNSSYDVGIIERNNQTNILQQRSGLGFYVSLNDMDQPSPRNNDETKIIDSSNRKLSKSLHHDTIKKKSSTGFYVDLSESDNSRTATPPLINNHNNDTPPSLNGGGSSNSSHSGGSNEKKNIFSMFIDFGDKKSISSKREPLSLASRLSNTLYQKRNENSSLQTSDSSQETLMSTSQEGTTNLRLHFNTTEKLDSAGETMIGSSDESRKPSLLLADDQESLSSPVVMRRTMKLQKDELKRHSWNNCEQQQELSRKDHHKRSSSLSSNSLPMDQKNIMNILDKIPLLSKTSSMSIDSSLSPFDDFTCSKSEISTYSNNSVTSTNSGGEQSGENLMKIASIKYQKKRRRDVQINETFDKSSQGSITDGVLSKDLSPSSNTDTTDELTFQQDDNVQELQINDQTTTGTNFTQIKELCRPTMETIIETKETASPKKIITTNNLTTTSSSAHTMETLHATIEKQKMLLETVNEHIETGSGGGGNTNNCGNDNFVKLSDLDKPSSAKFELHSPEKFMSKSVGNQRHLNRLFHENSSSINNSTTTNRIRPHSWAMTRSTGNNIQNITNSVENLRSLSRLFPHLSKEFSNSLPNDVYLEQGTSNVIVTNIINNHRSPSELDYLQSDLSTESSLASSFSRSGLDESTMSCRQPRRLGEDLLKMFLQEIATDVIVEVNGRRIKAHKCILRSRCQYFAAMLAGGWVQSSGNVISLQGYSYSSVHFALCHIYSGACHPPDGISLMELASLADLLGLEGLKEVTAHALKLNYCHNFHKPCSGCIDGILQVLPVALNHALDDLYRKSLKWTCKHYLKVWPTRAFAQLPSEIFGRCRQQIVAHLTSETVLESILDCDHLITQLVHCRWATIIENLVRDILDSAYAYVSDHFASLIASDSFLSLGHDKSSNIQQLENMLLRTASSLNSDQACRSYQRVTRLNAVLAAKIIKMPTNLNDTNSNNAGSNTIEVEEEMEWNEEFIRLVSAILSAVEQCLTRQCSRAMRVTAWQRMDLELRKKIQKLACLTEPLDIRRNTGGSNSQNFNGITKSGNTTITKQISFNSGNSRNQDLYQVKLAIQAHSKKALAQDTQLYRATAHTQTHTDRNSIQTIEKGVQANHDNRDSNMGKVMKTNSRAHVPAATSHFIPSNQQQQQLKSKPNPIEKSKSFGHRRTQSEDSSISTTASKTIDHSRDKPIVQRLSDIRPRYLEPRKSRTFTTNTINTTTTTTTTARTLNKVQIKTNTTTIKKGKHISSSDSSRNSSPAGGRKLPLNVVRNKIGTKSINMSLDSLTSPSKRSISSTQLKKSSNHHIDNNEISIDSLAGSMRSSMKTEKTISQESLQVNNGCGKRISRSNPGINKVDFIQPTLITKTTIIRNRKPVSEVLTGTSRFSKNNKSLQLHTNYNQNHQHNTAGSGSSPSSIMTNKSSSRLSSISSVANSPRDAFKNRSISVPAQTGGNIRKSFVSAKSREILAKKAAAATTDKQLNTDSAGSSDIEKKSSENLMKNLNTITTNKTNNIINKSINSNIPTRLRPQPPATLNLKKKINMNTTTITGQTTTIIISPTKLTSQQHKVLINKTNNLNKRNSGNNSSNGVGNYINGGNEKLNNMKKSEGSINIHGNFDKKSKKNDNKIENMDEKNEIRIESKLERSSTFCKEVSDLPVSELQIIE